MLVVAALGGNALLRRGDSMNADRQAHNAALAASGLAKIAEEHDLVVTHGNGPQIGFLALQSDEAQGETSGMPLDVLAAETEGMIGYWIARELRGRLPGREVATLLTQVEVDAQDPAFARATKPIGPIYDSAAAREILRTRGWTLAPQATGGFRRVVASPEPRAIVELEVVRLLVSSGVVVTCAGGGGIPVTRQPDGSFEGIEAVVDKDLASAHLATQLKADLLLLLTDQPGVYADWPEPASELIETATVETLRARRFEEGTMAPKIEAACRFVAIGGTAAIGELSQVAEILERRAGTHVLPNR